MHQFFFSSLFFTRPPIQFFFLSIDPNMDWRMCLKEKLQNIFIMISRKPITTTTISIAELNWKLLLLLETFHLTAVQFFFYAKHQIKRVWWALCVSFCNYYYFFFQPSHQFWTSSSSTIKSGYVFLGSVFVFIVCYWGFLYGEFFNV